MQALRGYTHVYAKERIFRIWLAWEPWVVLWKPETCETILSNNFLLEKSTQYQFLQPWLGTGLLTSGGAKWRSRRKLLVPAFHFKILHDFVPVFNEQAAVMVNKLKDTARRGWPIDIVPVITACALDIICGEFATAYMCTHMYYGFNIKHSNLKRRNAAATGITSHSA